MLMACPCLNVIIELKNENPKKLDCSQIEIGKSDLNDVFFKQVSMILIHNINC